MNMGRTFAKPVRASKLLYRGAEALVFRDGASVTKKRVKKAYRIPELDEKLRKFRTRREAKMLEKASVCVPKVEQVDEEEATIVMEYIEGELLRDYLEEGSGERFLKVMEKVGKNIAVLHKKNIVHGDLTTSNMILKGDEVYFVDFGLSVVSLKAEDKAVDLYVFKKSLESSHFRHNEELFATAMEGYASLGDKEVLMRLKKVEKRGRYKRKEGGSF